MLSYDSVVAMSKLTKEELALKELAKGRANHHQDRHGGRPKSTTRFTEEYKTMALAMVEQFGGDVKKAAKKLRINFVNINRWIDHKEKSKEKPNVDG